MSFATVLARTRAALLGLFCVAFGTATAQEFPKKVKTKTKNTRSAAPVAGKRKAATAAPGPVAPQPKSPLSSAPQVLTDLPAPAGVAASSLPGWFGDLGAAQARAKATNRPVVVVFSGSDWCKPCVVYEQEVFAQPAFAAYAKDRLVLAHFDYPRQPQNQPSAAQAKRNEAARARLNREGDFPLAVIVSPAGKVLAKTGYIAGGPAAFAAYLQQVVPGL